MSSDPSHGELLDALTARLERFQLHTSGHLLRWVQGADLTFAEMRVFLALADGQARTGAELAELAGLEVEMAYPALHKLEARGWLCEAERRHSIHGPGLEQLEELATIRRAAVGEFVASLPTDERQSLTAALCSDGSASAARSEPG